VDAPAGTVTLRYFAWVREKVGRSEEQVSLPSGIDTIAALIGWLRTRGPEYEAAFLNASVIRTAVDHVHAPVTAPVAGAKEIGFFPPVTGG
jgi:sulfur-carrier protein